MAHLWLVMSVPSSHVGTVTVEKVSNSLLKGLTRYTGSNHQMASLTGYVLHLPSLSVSGESKTANIVCSGSRKCLVFNFSFVLLPTDTHSKVIELLKASFGIHLYSLLAPHVLLQLIPFDFAVICPANRGAFLML